MNWKVVKSEVARIATPLRYDTEPASPRMRLPQCQCRSNPGASGLPEGVRASVGYARLPVPKFETVRGRP